MKVTEKLTELTEGEFVSARNNRKVTLYQLEEFYWVVCTTGAPTGLGDEGLWFEDVLTEANRLLFGRYGKPHYWCRTVNTLNTWRRKRGMKIPQHPMFMKL